MSGESMIVSSKRPLALPDADDCRTYASPDRVTIHNDIAKKNFRLGCRVARLAA